MAPPAESKRDAFVGFEGGVAGLSLADLIQLNAQNRFTGSFRVQREDRVGFVFFRDGEIVHAEVGDLAGEDAFRAILEWPGGQFGVEPNVVAARRTIHKTCEHLLLDAFRALDERRARREVTPAPAAPPPAAPRNAAADAVDAVRRVPGVASAVLLTKDGKRMGEDGYEAEVLAGRTLYLAMAAAELGAVLQAGDVRSASVQGSAQHLLVFAAKNHYLGVFARPESDPRAVDAAIRGALSKR